MKSLSFIKDIFKGICIGAGAILPGISSGVFCVILGIYDKLVNSVLNLFKDFKKNFLYLLPFGIGAFIGIVLFGNLLKFLYTSYPMQTKYSFIGLILGSIPLMIKDAHKSRVFKKKYILYTIIAFLIGTIMVILEKNNFSLGSIFGITSNSLLDNFSGANIYANSLKTYLFIAVCGFFMSIGIVVPGISSTLILMCFGVYAKYLEAVSSLNILFLIPLGIGVCIGGIIFLKLIKFLFDEFYIQTFYSIIGFTLGSILVLYEPISFDIAGIISILLFLVCSYIANLFSFSL